MTARQLSDERENIRLPRISVILPVYNAEPYLRSSIESILRQTFDDFELLIINDGSTDKSASVISTFEDGRIRFINNSVNQGTATVSNIGLKEATGEFVALMDADDVALPERFEKQVRFLEGNPQVGVLGTGSMFSDSKKRLVYPDEDQQLRADMFFYYPFRNPTLMLRNSIIKAHHLEFDPAFRHTLDYEFISRMIGYTKMANLAEPLLIYTVHQNQISTLKRQVFLDDSDKVCIRMLEYLGIVPDEDERRLHLKLLRGDFPGDIGTEVESWLTKIGNAKITNELFKGLNLQSIVDKLHPSRRRFIFSNKYTLGEWLKELRKKDTYRHYSINEIIKTSMRPVIKKMK